MSMSRVFDAPIITNDQSIDRLLAAPLPILLLLWRQDFPDDVNRMMKLIAGREAGRLIVAKVNASDNPEAARRFGVKHSLVLVGLLSGDEITRAEMPDQADVEQHAEFLLGRRERPAARRREAQPRPTNHVHNGTDSRPQAVTDATFEQAVLRSPLPVLVDFWAPWCGPCRIVAPILDRLARDYAGRLRIAKVNVDQNSHYAGVYGVQGIPTLLLVQNGVVVDRLVGALPEPQLRSRIEKLLNG